MNRYESIFNNLEYLDCQVDYCKFGEVIMRNKSIDSLEYHDFTIKEHVESAIVKPNSDERKESRKKEK